MQLEINKEILKNQVKVLREFLKKGGINLNQSVSYSLLAIIYGFESWNHLSAIIKKEESHNDSWKSRKINKMFNLIWQN